MLESIKYISSYEILQEVGCSIQLALFFCVLLKLLKQSFVWNNIFWKSKLLQTQLRQKEQVG